MADANANAEDNATLYTIRTRRLKQAALAAGDLTARVLTVLDCMDAQNIDLPIFLWALSWNIDGLITDHQARYQRTTLMLSDELPDILSAWETPPRHHGHGVRTKGGREAVRGFALELVSRLVEEEIEEVVSQMRRPPEEMTEDTLLSINWQDVINETRVAAPITWGLLRRAAYTPSQDIRNTVKSPDAVCPFVSRNTSILTHCL